MMSDYDYDDCLCWPHRPTALEEAAVVVVAGALCTQYYYYYYSYDDDDDDAIVWASIVDYALTVPFEM